MNQVPPHSDQAEQAVLGALLVDARVAPRVVPELAPQDFYRPVHEEIYAAIIRLFGSGEAIDVLTVAETLKDSDALDRCGGHSYINDLALVTVTTANTPYFVRKIKDKARLRGLLDICISTCQRVTDIQISDPEATAADIIRELMEQITSLSMNHRQDESMASITSRVYDAILQRVESTNVLRGISTGFQALDVASNGLVGGNLVVLAARPGMGKTAFALSIAGNVAKVGGNALMFSVEMSPDELVERMLYSLANSRDNRAALLRAKEALSGIPFVPLDRPELDLMEVRAGILSQPKVPELVIVDYLQLMDSDGENQNIRIGKISSGMKKIAREFKTTVLLLSQLSRAVESRQDKRPMLSDLRDSGSVEQDADIVWFLYRDEYYNEETTDPGVVDVIQAKCRNGPTGTVKLLADLKMFRFENMRQERITK